MYILAIIQQHASHMYAASFRVQVIIGIVNDAAADLWDILQALFVQL